MNEAAHSIELETMQSCTINDFCRLCANLEENMIPIYDNEGIDHLLEKKIKTHLPFLNICKNDVLPKRICYHCASAVLVWNELYISSSNADHKLRSLFEATSPYEESDNSKNHEPYADIEEMDNMPDKDFIEQSIEYGDITDTNIFNKIDKSNKILSQLNNIPSTSNTEDIVNPEDKSSEIPEDETLNPSLKSQIEIFTRGVIVANDDDEGDVDHNVYLNAVSINDIDVLPYMDCHRLDDECNGLLEPKREYEEENEINDQINEDVDDVDLNHYRRQNLRRQYHRVPHNIADITSNGDINTTMSGEDDDHEEMDVKPRITHIHGNAEDFLKEEGDDCYNQDDDEDEGECCDPINLEIRQLYINGTEEESNDQQSETMCQLCATVFKTRYNLLRHFQKRHPEYKMYECDLCRISFPSIEEFKDHLEEKHSKSQLTTHAVDSRQVRFACDVCGNMYKNKASAMNHLLTHTAKKNVRCTRCDFTCYTKQQLGVHQTKHDKRFVCDICNKRFAQKSQLDVHVNAVHYNHRPYRCLLCSKSFKTKGSHDAHMIVHTDTRNYQCPHCDKKCRKRYDLTLHIRTHTGEKPFKCSVCGRGFVQMCDTRKHEMLHYRKGKKTALFYTNDTTSALEDE